MDTSLTHFHTKVRAYKSVGSSGASLGSLQIYIQIFQNPSKRLSGLTNSQHMVCVYIGILSSLTISLHIFDRLQYTG